MVEILLFPLLFLAFLSPAWFGSAVSLQASGRQALSEKMLWSIDFTHFSDNIEQELLHRAFLLKKEMANDDKIRISLENQRLAIRTIKPAFGLMIKNDLHLDEAEWVEIEWGIEAYPEHADWSKGKNQEALMVYVFFGEPVDADRFYLPDSPYFIGLFLGQHEEPLTSYIGKSYTRTGRYVCLGNPAPGETIASRYNILQAYREMFATDHVPPVTGIAIEVDTGSLQDGRSSSFIHRISLIKTEST